jgi:signal transduction histidine kinase
VIGLPTGVRTRILSAVLIITAAGMIFAGTISYLLTREDTAENLTAQLEQEVSEFRRAVTVAQDPANKVPIRTEEDLLRYAIKATIPDRDEAVVGLVDGRVVLVAANETPLQRSVPEDRELIAAAAAVAVGDPVRIRTISTPTHDDLVYASVPVVVDGQPGVGHYLAVIDVDQAYTVTNRIYLTYAAICLVTLVLIAVIGNVVARRLLAPLRTLQRTAQQITDADLSGRIPADQLASGDEIADVGLTMNAMLDRLSASFDQQRHLLDDAGHELRTPLTIVRGHLELVDPTDPTDVVATRDLAIDEIDRMHRMVDELILLAKARRPDFVVPEPVPLALLLAGVVDKLRPLADRDWRLEGEAGSSDATVEVDPQRVTQALVQLAANAVRFTGTGAVIAVGARVTAGPGPAEVALWVRDEGAGIEPAEQAGVFERFHRGAAQAAVHPEGAGLGLAIVAAIAAAHSGRVELSSAVGRGSVFTLVLPTTLSTSGPESPATEPSKEHVWQRS